MQLENTEATTKGGAQCHCQIKLQTSAKYTQVHVCPRIVSALIVCKVVSQTDL